MRTRRTLQTFLTALGLVALTSCAWISDTGPLKSAIVKDSPSYRLVPIQSPADVPVSEIQYGRADLPAHTKGEAYSELIRVRDVLHVTIADVDERSTFRAGGQAFNFGPVEIPADGKVSIPYVGEVQVLGRKLSAVADEINEKIRPVSNSAQASVIRSERLMPTANVIGDVAKPGPVPITRKGMDSMDLLAIAGGPTEVEHLRTYTLRRGGRDYFFDHLGFRRNPFPVEEGDTLAVSKDITRRFHVMGSVNRPNTILFPSPQPMLMDALGAAIGFDERRSDASGLFVFRKGEPAVVYTFDLKDPAVLPLIQRFPIKSEDVVYVTEAPLSRWSRLIGQLLPISVTQAANSASRFSN